MMSEEEFLKFIFECIEEGGEAEWPLYIPPSRIASVQQVEPEESQQESPLEIEVPPVEPDVQEPKQIPRSRTFTLGHRVR
jgi:hypothetical protein